MSPKLSHPWLVEVEYFSRCHFNKFYNHNKNKTIPIATLNTMHYKQSVGFSCSLRFIIREENRSKEGDAKTK